MQERSFDTISDEENDGQAAKYFVINCKRGLCIILMTQRMLSHSSHKQILENVIMWYTVGLLQANSYGYLVLRNEVAFSYHILDSSPMAS